MEQISIMLILIHGFYSKLKTILPFNIYLLIIYLAALGVAAHGIFTAASRLLSNCGA